MQVLDVLFVQSSVVALRAGDKGYQLLFMFEYAILACIGCACFVKYGLAVADTAMTETWENKGLYMLYLELAVDAANLMLYVAFFAMIVHKYTTIPLHLIRDIYMAYMSLWRRVTNYVRYCSVTSKIHQLLDVTEADLERVGGSCIICREDMAIAAGLKKLPCGHVFHLSCLRSWLERQQTCPICRTSILPAATAEAPEQAPAAAQVPDAAAAAAGAAAPHPLIRPPPGGFEAARARAAAAYLGDDLDDIAPAGEGGNTTPVPATHGFRPDPQRDTRDGTGGSPRAGPSTSTGRTNASPSGGPGAGASTSAGPSIPEIPLRMTGHPRPRMPTGMRIRPLVRCILLPYPPPTSILVHFPVSCTAALCMQSCELRCVCYLSRRNNNAPALVAQLLLDSVLTGPAA
jgi:hypothetical protein